MSDEILKIVEEYRGTGFNDKFENLCLDFKNTVNDRKKELDRVNKQIDNRQTRLAELENRLREMDRFIFNLNTVREQVLKVRHMADNMPFVSQVEIPGAQLQQENEIQTAAKRKKEKCIS